MTKEEYQGVEAVQIAISRLASTLGVIGNAAGSSDPVSDAIDLCADMADRIAREVDRIPGFLDAQIRRD